jgi:hypothetical protein
MIKLKDDYVIFPTVYARVLAEIVDNVFLR